MTERNTDKRTENRQERKHSDSGNRRKRKRSGDLLAVMLTVLVLFLLVVLGILLYVGNGSKNGRDSETTVSKPSSGSTETEQMTSSDQNVSESSTDDGDISEDSQTEDTGILVQPEHQTERETDGETETASEPATETELSSEAESEPETEEFIPLTVAIDPGHQGSWVDMSDPEPNAPGSSEMKAKATTGTQGSYTGIPEYELNLQISLLLRDELESRGYRVVLTREDNDTAISNSERALKAYDEGGDIYVRIHANGSDDSGVQGALAMVPSSSNPYVGDLAEDSYLLADCILEAYCDKASFTNLGIQYYDNMTGMNWSKIPVMILEMGFMTNESDDTRMNDSSVQPLMAEGIADGIDQYFEEKGMTQGRAGSLGNTDAEKTSEKLELLAEQLEEEYIGPASDSGETWAVSIRDLSDDAGTDLNGGDPIASASVMKLFIMASVYEQILYPDEDRDAQQTADPGEIRQLLADMITVSSNDAANRLVEILGGGDAYAGMELVNAYCEAHGYTSTFMGRKFLEQNPTGDNVTSANDCRDLLTEIYRRTCVSEEASAEMHDLLKQQTRTGKIPAGIEDGNAVTANKTGELAGDYGQYVENDTAIVDNGSSAYIICVLSQNLNDNGSAVTRIQSISRLVYETLGS